MNGPVIGPEHIQFELLNEPVMQAQPARTCAPCSPRQVARRETMQDSSPSGTFAMPAGNRLAKSLGQIEKDLILEALRSGSPRREVAERLGISPRTLRHKLARLREAGVEVPAA